MPNPDLCIGLEPLSTYALRDIKKGEEVRTSCEKFGIIVHPCKFLLAFQLREDYATCEYPAWFLALCKNYEIDFNYVKI